VKSPRSLLAKIRRRGLPLEIDVIRKEITDIAGIRITCSFIADTYHVLELLTAQDDIRVVEIKDYIAHPKPNGYRSLHAILEVPVFLHGGPVPVICEVQIRTIAMDFWASLEHKIHYKFNGDVPDRLDRGAHRGRRRLRPARPTDGAAPLRGPRRGPGRRHRRGLRRRGDADPVGPQQARGLDLLGR
jgi:ppGpp synthetase/RelA/SpoT-type nucleotidyltranferase